MYDINLMSVKSKLVSFEFFGSRLPNITDKRATCIRIADAKRSRFLLIHHTTLNLARSYRRSLDASNFEVYAV